MPRDIAAFVLFIVLFFSAGAQTRVFVSSGGNNSNSGTLLQPLQTLQAALDKTANLAGVNVTIALRAGIYYLDSTLLIRSNDCSNHSLTIRAYKTEKVIISGAKPYRLQWQWYKNGIYKAPIEIAKSPDRLFLNGAALSMARYPNYDSAARVFNGTAADAISDEKIKQWQNPAGAYVHALHKGEWGDFHYLVTGKDANGKLLIEGGWQNNRPSPMNDKYRFVENVFEELDAPGEWYYDAAAKTIYVYPPRGTDLEKSTLTIGQLEELMVLKGSAAAPLKNVIIRGIRFEQTNRTFMRTKEPLLRSDWTIYRGAAFLMDGTERCVISNCVFTEIGGNAIFLSNYNRHNLIKENHIYNIGASAVLFVGNPDAVRSPSFSYDTFVSWSDMDYSAGPKSNNYPQDCSVEDNLIHATGTIEKQSAGVQIAMAKHITVSHNTIYHVPRAGINIGDGCWGGHVIAYNDVFNTVLETGDHGAFNSWGRDRFWRPQRSMIDSIVAAKPGIELLDVMEPNIIRNNRFQCDHGWDIDLDDGSSNYRIYNNICLSGGLKLREGYHRIVYNNIIINNTFHPHVWQKNSGDLFMHNIVTTAYAPIQIDDWGKQVDSNFFLSEKALAAAKKEGVDQNSQWGDAMFTNAAAGNYTVKTGSPALKTGFANFGRNIGVRLPVLQQLAAKPPIRPLITATATNKSLVSEWLGAIIKNIETLGEQSAAGLPDNKGALLINVPTGSAAFKNGLQKGDVVIKINGNDVQSVIDLLQAFQKLQWMGAVEISIVRNQSVKTKAIKINE